MMQDVATTPGTQAVAHTPCLIPEYAIGIRAFRTVASDAFGLPRCLRDAIHGAKVGAWEYRGGRKIVYWERITP